MSGGALIGLRAAMKISKGISQDEQAHAEARVLTENGRRMDTQGAYDAVSSLRESRLQEGVDITSGAASGVGLSSLSDLLEQNAVERQLEAMNIRYSAMQRGDAVRTQAAAKRAEGDSALFAGVLRAGAGAIQGGAQNNANRSGSTAATRSYTQAMGTIPIPGGR